MTKFITWIEGEGAMTLTLKNIEIQDVRGREIFCPTFFDHNKQLLFSQ